MRHPEAKLRMLRVIPGPLDASGFPGRPWLRTLTPDLITRASLSVTWRSLMSSNVTLLVNVNVDVAKVVKAFIILAILI